MLYSNVRKQFLIECFLGNKQKIINKIRTLKHSIHDNSQCDFLTVIPKYKRHNHFVKIYECLEKCNKASEFNHKIIVVEHSESPESLDFCKNKNINYVFLKKEEELFNKCLCMNIGSFFNNSKYIHFHDTDLWMPKDFWKKLKINKLGKKAIQSFAKKRVNYLNEEITEKIFSENISISEAVKNSKNWKEGKSGAPGGSLVIERNLFNQIGGFDPYYFWAYSIEDQFFVDKINLFTKFYSCDRPPIEMFHLWHSSNEKNTPEKIRKKGIKTRNYFCSIKNNEKFELIKMFKDFLNVQYKNIDLIYKNENNRM